MSDTYGDEPLKYLSQTPQRQRDEIHRLQGAVEALRRERDTFYMDYRMKCDAETKTLHGQLAASQAREQQLREALELCNKHGWVLEDHAYIIEAALALPHGGTEDEIERARRTA